MLIGKNKDKNKKFSLDYEKKDLDLPKINNNDNNTDNQQIRAEADSN